MATPQKRVEEVYEALYAKIISGAYGEGFIPPHTQLKEEYQTSLKTIKEVFSLLRAMGLVRKKGKGLTVSNPKIKIPALTESFDSYLKDHNMIPFQENIADPTEVKLDYHTAEKFGLEPETIAIKRVRLQGEIQGRARIPYRVAETYYPRVLVKDKWLEQLLADPYFNLTKALKDEIGQEINYYHLSSEIRFPLASERVLLQTELEVPIYEVFRRCYASDGTLIMFNHLLLVSYFFKWEFQGPIKQF